MNLENLGVQELNAQEVKSIDGGNDFTDGFCAGTGGCAMDRSRITSFWYGFAWGLGRHVRANVE